MDSIIPAQHQPPRGPVCELHNVAGSTVPPSHRCTGSTIALLLKGSVNMYQSDSRGNTLFMYAANRGFQRVSRAMLRRGPTRPLKRIGTFPPVCGGPLAVTVDLINAVADLKARTSWLTLAVQYRGEVVAASIETGAKSTIETGAKSTAVGQL